MKSRCAIVLLFILCSLARAQIVVDNFDTPNTNWREDDFNAGQSWGPGIFDMSGGVYTLATAGALPPGTTAPHGTVATWKPSIDDKVAYSQGYYQGKVRANTEGSTVSLLIRADPDLGLDYGFFASTLYGTFGIEVFDARLPEPQRILGLMDRQQFPFAAGEEWIIKGGAVGDQFTMKVWRPGQVEPAQPQLSVTD
jgi:hypothetical protein